MHVCLYVDTEIDVNFFLIYRHQEIFISGKNEILLLVWEEIFRRQQNRKKKKKIELTKKKKYSQK